MAKINVYTDGSFGIGGCNGIKKCGGLGIFSENLVIKNCSIHVDGNNLTNIMMEALAIRTAIIRYNSYINLTIITDSDHCYDALTSSRAYYIENGWINKTSTLVAEFQILIQCVELIKKRREYGKHTKFKVVKGHGSSEGNIEADKLATQGRLNLVKIQSIFELKINIFSHIRNTVAETTNNLNEDLLIAINEIDTDSTLKDNSNDIIHITSELPENIILNNPIMEHASKLPKVQRVVQQDGTIFTFYILCTRVVHTMHTKCSSSIFSIIKVEDLPSIVTVYCKSCSLLSYVSKVNSNIDGLISALLISTSPIFTILKNTHKTNINIAQLNGTLVSVPVSSVTNKCNFNCWFSSIDTNTGHDVNFLNGGFI